MTPLILITTFTLVTAFGLVFFSNYKPELIFALAFLVLIICGALPTDKAFSGLANPGVITLGCLFIVAGGLRSTAALDNIISKLLKPQQHNTQTKSRLLPPLAALSAFFNNTPIVASITPAIVSWCKRYGISPSKLLLPISYAAILGGTCTIIGTSTNLIIYGLLQTDFPGVSFGFFEIAKIGLPITILGLLYLVFFSNMILPERKIANTDFDNIRAYTFEMLVEDQGSLINKTIEAAGLRGLQGVFLIELIRDETRIGNVKPGTVLRANDRLVFSGSVSSISDLASLNGLAHPEKHMYKLGDTINTRILEVVVTTSNSLVGQTIKQCNFRQRHQSVVIAVVRNGERIDKKTGDIIIHAGDLLLMHASNDFSKIHKHSRDFLILQSTSGNNNLRGSYAKYAWLSLASVVFLAAFNFLPIVVAAFVGVLITILSGCVTANEARRSVDFNVLALIVFAFGFGEAIIFSGLGNMLEEIFIGLNGLGPFALLAGVYLFTLVLTELITNNAAAVIVFSLLTPLVEAMYLNIVPYAVAIMLAASASFITPLGYQTNLMVYSAGNYRFSDYVKLGLPMSLLVMAISLILIPVFWPLKV